MVRVLSTSASEGADPSCSGSPEQARGEVSADGIYLLSQQSSIFQVASMLVHLITGQLSHGDDFVSSTEAKREGKPPLHHVMSRIKEPVLHHLLMGMLIDKVVTDQGQGIAGVSSRYSATHCLSHMYCESDSIFHFLMSDKSSRSLEW